MWAGGDVLADVVGADRQLAVSAVDQDGELDGLGPAEVDECVHRRADRAARVEDVVDEHDDLPVDVGDPDRGERRRLAQADVVAVEADVERAGRDVDALDLGDLLREALRQVDAAGQDPDEHDPGGALVALDDLVSDARQSPSDIARVHHRGLGREGLGQFVASPDGPGGRRARKTPAATRACRLACSSLCLPFRASQDPLLKGFGPGV